MACCRISQLLTSIVEEVDFDHKSRENCIGILYVFLRTISVLSAELTPIQGRHLKFKITEQQMSRIFLYGVIIKAEFSRRYQIFLQYSLSIL